MDGSRALHLNEDQRIPVESIGVRGIEISLGRVVTWTMIFTNTFFVSYFFAKLFQWI